MIKILAAAMIAVLINGVSFAQGREKRIEFAAGKSSATVSDRLAAEETLTYSLRVKKGQKIAAKVTSPGGKVEIDGANISAGEFEGPGTKSFNVPVDQTGDYQVYVRNTGKSAARFTLTVTVR